MRIPASLVLALGATTLASAADPKGYYYPEPPPMETPQASVTVVNMTAGGTGADFALRINGTAYARGLAYGATSAPYSVATGQTRFEVGTSVASTPSTMTLMDDESVLLVAYGDGVARPYGLLLVPDDGGAGPAIQLVNVSAHVLGAAGLGLRTDAGERIAGLDAVAPRSAGAHVRVAAGTHDLKVMDAPGQATLVDLRPFAMASADRTTLVVGGDGATQAMAVASTATQAPLPTEMLVDLTYDGAFYDAGVPGQGFVFAVVPSSDRLTGAWFTFGTQAGQHDWLLIDTGPAGFDGRIANAQMFRASGGRLADPSAPVSIAPAGTMRIEFSGCDGARVTIARTDVAFQREMTLGRLTPRGSCSVPP